MLGYEYTGYPKPAIAEKMAESKPERKSMPKKRLEEYSAKNAPESNPEKPKNRKLRRKVPKPVRENRACTGWTYNRLGTKQTMVCKW